MFTVDPFLIVRTKSAVLKILFRTVFVTGPTATVLTVMGMASSDVDSGLTRRQFSGAQPNISRTVISSVSRAS